MYILIYISTLIITNILMFHTHYFMSRTTNLIFILNVPSLKYVLKIIKMCFL